MPLLLQPASPDEAKGHPGTAMGSRRPDFEHVVDPLADRIARDGTTGYIRRGLQVPGATDCTRTSSPAPTLRGSKAGACSVSVIGCTGTSSMRSSQPLGGGLTSLSVTSTLPFGLSTLASYASSSANSGRSGNFWRSALKLTAPTSALSVAYFLSIASKKVLTSTIGVSAFPLL